MTEYVVAEVAVVQRALLVGYSGIDLGDCCSCSSVAFFVAAAVEIVREVHSSTNLISNN